jgi:hypothetical protein
VTGVVTTSDASDRDQQTIHRAEAACPPGKQVVGGGAKVSPTNELTRGVTLTRVEPVERVSRDHSLQGYAVEARTVQPVNPEWSVTAYAICADPIPGHDIRVGYSNGGGFSSAEVQKAAASCPAGQRAVGSGAMIHYGGGRVGLQVARPSGDGRLTRAQAHEVGSYTGTWRMNAYAVCVDQPEGYDVQYGDSFADDSERTKSATRTCSSGQRLGTAGAITDVASGAVSLHSIYPYGNGGRVWAFENTDTSEDWDFIVAQVICVA